MDDTVEIGQVIAVVQGDEASTAALAAAASAVAVVPAAHPSLQQLQRVAAQPPAVPSSTPPVGKPREPALPSSITRRLATVVPASMQVDAGWKAMRAAREATKGAGRDHSPSMMLAWAVCGAMERHAAFRCVITREGEILQQEDFELGFAVALEGDRLATAVIRDANRLGFTAFAAAYAQALADTRAGRITEVQSPINLTSLGAFGVESAIPIVVPPAVGTLFIGRAHERLVNDGGQIYPQEVITLSLTFDHRVVNGAGAAAFMHDVKAQIEGFALSKLSDRGSAESRRRPDRSRVSVLPRFRDGIEIRKSYDAVDSDSPSALRARCFAWSSCFSSDGRLIPVVQAVRARSIWLAAR